MNTKRPRSTEANDGGNPSSREGLAVPVPRRGRRSLGVGFSAALCLVAVAACGDGNSTATEAPDTAEATEAPDTAEATETPDTTEAPDTAEATEAPDTAEATETTQSIREAARLAEPFRYKNGTASDTLPEAIADEMGFFEKYNLEPELVNAAVGGIAWVPLIESGEVDATNGVGSSAPIITRLNGAKVMAVGAAAVTGPRYPFWAYWVRADADLSEAADFEGKRLAVNNAGATPDITFTAWMKSQGADPSTLQRVTVPYANMVPALLSDQVDIIAVVSSVIGPYFAENPDEEAEVVQILTASDTAPTDRNTTSILFSEKFIADHPEVVTAHLAAIQDTVEWIETHQDEARQIWLDRGMIKSLDAALPYWPKNLCIDTDAADQWVTVLEDGGLIPPGETVQGSWYTNELNPLDCPQ